MKEIELKPCPFCGSKEKTIYSYDPYDGYQGNCTHHCVRCDKCGATVKDSVFENAVNKWESRTNNQKWISVEDRLPEDNETVLTIDTESVMEVCFYQTEWKGVFQRYGGLVKIFNITHWMPLPEAPKGERE